jgi:hypothetical protein
MSSSILFVDSRVADYQSLLANLSADNLGGYEAALGEIGEALSESGDILLYG